MKIIPTILCGGSGTRLWPVSWSRAPKQLQFITNDKSLLANTVLRMRSHEKCLDPVLICGRSYVDEIEAQMAVEGANISAVITEPKGRDTAAAAAMAAHWGAKIQKEFPDEEIIVMLLPADHHIGNVDLFHDAISAAAEAATKNHISTIGITPNTPATAYGYINRSPEPLEGLDSYGVQKFVEKPDIAKAREYLASGEYLWNAGMFAFRPEVFLSELNTLAPEIAAKSEAAFEDATPTVQKNGVTRIDLRQESFMNIPALSIDYAVMENTKIASVHPADFGWSDVGSWSTVYDVSEKDADGNAISGDVITVDSKNSLIRSHNKLIAAVDVEDLIIVDTMNSILICPMSSSQKVKDVHKKLLDRGQSLPPPAISTLETQKNLVTEKIRNWLFDKALPFWTDVGFDTEYGGVFEEVDFAGRPLKDMPKRTRVLARQTYVFAHSYVMGYKEGLDAMRVPLDFLLKHGQVAPGQFAKTLNRDGSIKDSRADAYDHAFILFALAWAYKVTGDEELLKVAEQTMEFVMSEMRHPVIGFREVLPESNVMRRANPHMHLFESAIIWMTLHQHPRMAELADELFRIFQSKFCLNGLVREYFEDDLSKLRSPPSPRQTCLEPGHLYEWTYLLKQFEVLTGRGHESASIMEAFADAYGHSQKTGLILDLVYPNGRPFEQQSSRLWPQTEYIRLKLYNGTDANRSLAMAMVDRLMTYFFEFEDQLQGYWRDTLDGDGENLINRAPVSSFYHILGSIERIIAPRSM